MQLVVSREAAEWNSSATYVAMLAHAEGDLRLLLRNVARDEIKHLCILAAADLYLFGPRPWRRSLTLVRGSFDQFGRHRRRRSRGELMGTNFVTSVEVIASHLLMEFSLHRWLASLPLSTLASVFDSASELPALAAIPVPPGPAAESESASRTAKESRLRLARWRDADRRRAQDLRNVEASRAEEVAEVVRSRLGDFRGAESPGSPVERRLLRQIGAISDASLRAPLRDRLRDYQIRNNRHALAAPERAGDVRPAGQLER